MSIKRLRHRYRRALIRELRKPWRRCVWTWPFGHTWPKGARSSDVCEDCGRPNCFLSNFDIYDLEKLYETQSGIGPIDPDEDDEEVVEAAKASIPKRLWDRGNAYYTAGGE